MIYAVSALSIVAFVSTLRALRIVPVSTEAVALSRTAIRIMRDSTLADDEKERTLRRASFALLRSFVSIALRGTLALGASLAPPAVAQAAGVVSVSDVTGLLVTWEAIGLAFAAMVAAQLVGTPE